MGRTGIILYLDARGARSGQGHAVTRPKRHYSFKEEGEGRQRTIARLPCTLGGDPRSTGAFFHHLFCSAGGSFDGVHNDRTWQEGLLIGVACSCWDVQYRSGLSYSVHGSCMHSSAVAAGTASPTMHRVRVVCPRRLREVFAVLSVAFYEVQRNEPCHPSNLLFSLEDKA